MTDQTNSVTTIQSTTYNKCKFEVTTPEDSGSLMLEGLTIDHNGHLLIGGKTNSVRYLLTYTQDGVKSAKITLEPSYLAATRLNSIVVSSMDPQMVQIADPYTGRSLYTLHVPTSVSDWWPRGVCCTDGRIFVANAAMKPADTGIFCYSISGRYLDCITTDVSHPRGLVLTDNNNTLMVTERDGGIKVFVIDEMDTSNDHLGIPFHTSDPVHALHSQCS